MPTSTITGSIIDGAGTPVAGVTVYARLRPYNASRISDGSTVANPPSTTTNGSGVYSFTLEQQANIGGTTWWELEEDTGDLQGGRRVRTVSAGANAATVQQSEVTPAALLGPSALTQAQGDARYIAQGSMWVFVTNATYGAKGDGVTDDTAAIQAAIETVANAGGGIVYLPRGTYLTGQLTLANGVTLKGAGSSNNTGLTNPTFCKLKLKNGANASLLLIPKQKSGITLEDLEFDGNKANQTGTSHAIECVAATSGTIGADNHDAWLTLNRCYVHDALTDGVFIGVGHRAVNIENSYVMSAGRDGVSVNGSDAFVFRSVIGANGRNGVYVHSAVTQITGNAIFSNLVNILCEGDLSDGFGASYNTLIVGNGIDRASQHGLQIKVGAFDVTVVGNSFNGNSQSGAGSYSQIRLEDTSGRHSATGNTFYDDTGSIHPHYDVELAGSCTISAAGNVHGGSNTAGTTNTAGGLRSAATSRGQFYVDDAGVHKWAAAGGAADVDLYRDAAGRLKTTAKLVASGGLGVGNSAAATTPGAVTGKIQVFDDLGNSLGYLPVYAAIT